MKNIIFSKRPSLVEVTLQFEDGVDRKPGRTYKLVDASTCHRIWSVRTCVFDILCNIFNSPTRKYGKFDYYAYWLNSGTNFICEPGSSIVQVGSE